MQFHLLVLLLGLNCYVRSAAVYKYARPWKDNTVVYEISTSVLEKVKTEILAVMRDIEEISCVKFVDRSKDHSDSKYVKIVNGRGCNSPSKGMPSGASCTLTMGSVCHHRGEIRHTLMKLLGFGNEQQRADRDKYIKVNPKQMHPCLFRSYYTKYSGFNFFNSTFDFDSINLFSPYITMRWFSSEMAWERKNVREDHPIISGHFRDFSFWDVRTLNKFYKCEDQCKENKPKCEYPNFINHKCKCVSRESYADERCVDKPQSGANCQTLTANNNCYLKNKVNEECRKSCGVCFRYKNHGNAPRPEACYDEWSKERCMTAVKKGKCKSSLEVRANCEVSCKLKCNKPKYKYPYKRCEDKKGLHYCEYWKQKNLCSTQSCAKTCGTCKRVECVDQFRWCKNVPKQGRCDDLGKSCVKSCTNCVPAVKKSEKPKKCADLKKKSWCKKVVNQNRCSDLGDQCRKSCKICMCNDGKNKRYCKMVIEQDRCEDLGKNCMESCNKC